MKRVDFDKIQINSGDHYRIEYRSNWHGNRTKVLEGEFMKVDDHITELYEFKRYSYRNIISIVRLR